MVSDSIVLTLEVVTKVLRYSLSAHKASHDLDSNHNIQRKLKEFQGS